MLKTDSQVPWIESSRPKSLDDVVGQDEIMRPIRNACRPDKNGNYRMQHMLLHGPPGTGKTSTAHAIANLLFGEQGKTNKVLELNASAHRGIDAVRNKIGNFASQAPPRSGNVPFRLLILEEADAMTEDAQNALRRRIESATKSTRFILVCNYKSRIIEPIVSRCAKYRFRPISNDAIASHLHNIVATMTGSEQRIPDDVLSCIIHSSRGDLRRAIGITQSCARIYGLTQVTVDDVHHYLRTIPSHRIENLALLARTNIINAYTECTELINDAFFAKQIVDQLAENILQKFSTFSSSSSSSSGGGGEKDEEKKAEEEEFLLLCRVGIQLARADYQLGLGTSEILPLANVLAVWNGVLVR